jgi:hypothetical protein
MPSDTVERGKLGFRLPESGHLRRSPRTFRSEGQEPLHVLPRGDHQGLGVDLLEPPEPEPPRAVPLLGLREERLDLHRAFAQGLAAGFGVAVRPHPFEVLLFEAAAHPAPFARFVHLFLRGQALQAEAFAAYLTYPPLWS